MSVPSSILECIFRHAQETPERIAIADRQSEYTYAAFWDHITGLAAHLKAQGLAPGEKVVVVNSQNPAFLLAAFAIELAGGVFVPMEKNVAQLRLDEILLQTGAPLLFSDKPYQVSIPSIALADIPALAQASMDAARQQPADFPDTNSVSEILFTTGTTGKSKGVVMRYGASLAVAENVQFGVRMKPGNVELIPIPINHSYGLRRSYANLINGGTVLIMDGVAFVGQVYDLLDTYHGTAMALVPAAASTLLQFSREKLASYRHQLDYIQIGTASFPESEKVQLCEVLPETRLYNFYGCSEAGCSIVVDYNQPGNRPFCIGKPTVHSHVVFVDEHKKKLEATRENPGFLAVGGEMLMEAYYEDEAETQNAMGEGLLYSKDLAYTGEDGNIYLIGRKDNVINVGGNKVAPEEIEDCALRLPGVADCACIPVDDAFTGQAPKLFVVMEPGVPFAKADIRKGLAAYLEKYKLPRHIEEIDTIPRTYNGKIQRNALQ